MTKDQDDNDSDFEIPTLAKAKQQQKQEISELREGNQRERRLADALERCRKDNRCNLPECAICERRKERAKSRIYRAPQLKTIMGRTDVTVGVDDVKVVGKRRPLDDKKVREIGASISQIGLLTPITVRMVGKKIVLVTGWHRLAAARSLGWKQIRCSYMTGRKIDARLAEIAENLHRAELTSLERAELIEEWRALIRQKNEVGQVAPPGGRQPSDAGINKTAKALGLTKEEIRRSKAIARISAEAKAEAKKLRLDNNQSALLAIAKLPTPKAQLMAVREIDERKRAARARDATAAATLGDRKATTKIKKTEARIREKMAIIDGLNNEVATLRKRLRERQETLVAKCVDTALIATTSPSTAPTDDQDVPPISDQGLLSPGDEASFAAVTAAWGNAHAQQIAKEAFIEIAEWRCNAREIVRVRLTKYCGRDVVDLRVWGLAGNGEYRPGPNGITLDIKQLPKLAKAVKKANRQAEVAAMIDAS